MGLEQPARASRARNGTGELEAGQPDRHRHGRRRQIAWNKPISAVFDAHDAAGGEPIVDRLLCESDFLTRRRRRHDRQSDRQALLEPQSTRRPVGPVRRSRRPAVRPARARAISPGNARPSEQFDAGADLQLRGFQLGMTDQPLWREDSLLVVRLGEGPNQFRRQHPHRRRHAERQERSRSDRREAPGAGQGSARRRRVAGQRADAGAIAELARPTGRLVPPMNNVQLAGGFILQADGTASKDGAELRQLGFAAEPLIVKSPWLNINEKRIDAALAAGSWNRRSGVCKSPSASFKCATAAVDCQERRHGLARRRTARNWPARSTTKATPAAFGNGSPIPNCRRPGDWPDNSKARPPSNRPPASCMAQPPPNWPIWRSSIPRASSSRSRSFDWSPKAITTRKSKTLQLSKCDVDLQRADGRRRRTRCAGRRATKRATRRQSSTTTWNA